MLLAHCQQIWIGYIFKLFVCAVVLKILDNFEEGWKFVAEYIFNRDSESSLSDVEKYIYRKLSEYYFENGKLSKEQVDKVIKVCM